MAIKVFDTLSRKKQVFKPIKEKSVNLFVCGLTPYDYSHIGHAKTYIAFDVIVKYLRYKKYKVFYLQNITDIDDKIIKRAKEEGTTWKEVSNKYTKAYYEDMESLGIDSINKYAPATKYIEEILKQVRTLIEKGYAYKLDDGIYYDISMFKDYGKLSGRTALEAEDSVSKIDDSIGKRNKGDFCLWKFPKEGEPFWESKLGSGRPGWHIEDTAITETEFGPQYDIHGGAKDLIFPHHEAEIAQMEAASGKKPLVKYWLHTGFLNVEGRKMSKSLGNFVTIQDALKKYDADTIRMMFVSTHYRSAIDYSEASVKQAKANLETIRNAISVAKKKTSTKKWIAKFEKFMDDDFNTPQVVALLLEMAKHINKTMEDLSPAVYEIGDILGVDFKPQKQRPLPSDLRKLIEKREELRAQKKWTEADKIRSELKEKGILLDDTAEGTKWRCHD